MRLCLAVAALIAFVVTACGGDRDSAPRSPSTAASGLPVIDLRYDGGVLRVEVASTGNQRSVGLSNRDALADGTGMLFDLQRTAVASFWMKDTLIPLDLIWVDASRKVAGIAHAVPEPGVPDQQLKRYSSDVPVSYVLELAAGEAAERGIVPGDMLEFTLPPSREPANTITPTAFPVSP